MLNLKYYYFYLCNIIPGIKINSIHDNIIYTLIVVTYYDFMTMNQLSAEFM